MLHIQPSNPWLFWPNHICDTFPETPANKFLTGDKEFELYVDLTINKTQDIIGTLFTLLPHYTAMDIYSGRLLFTIMYSDKNTKYWDLPVDIYDGVNLKVKWVHEPNKAFTIFINKQQVHKVNLKEKGFCIESNPHIIFGAGNFPKNGFNLNYVDITLNEFKVLNDNKLYCHHKFQEYIFDKSVDITNNCNFINKI